MINNNCWTNIIDKNEIDYDLKTWRIPMNTLISKLKLNKIIETKGLTLIEIIISLALLGIILVPIFSFYFFGANIYKAAEKKSKVQNDILFAAEFITKELRTATDIYLNKTLNQNKDLYNCSIGLKNGCIEYYYNNKSKPLTNSVIIELSFTLKRNSNLLEFHIIGEEGKGQYRIDSKVTLLNLEKLPEQDCTGNWIHYFNPSIE